MPSRLEMQRQPGRAHRRTNSRKYRRGYTVLPHNVWGDSYAPVGPSGPITIKGVNPNTFAATTGSKVFVITGTGFVAPVTVMLGATTYTGGAVVVDSVTQITLTIPDGSVYASSAGGLVDLWVTMTVGSTNHVRISVTATAGTVEAPLLPGDPGAYVISVVEQWVDAHPDQADEVVTAEQGRPSPRITLVDWLQGFISHRDEGTIP